MKKILTLLTLALAIVVTGCTTESVPPGYVGIVVAKNGIQPDIYGPGRAPVTGRDRLVLVEASSKMRAAPVKVIMTDRYTDDETGEMKTRIGVEMDFTVNTRFRLDKTPSVVIAMIQDMNLAPGTEQIPVMQVYQKYGNMVVGRVSREILGTYTPEEVLANLDQINKALDKGIKKSLSGSPLIVSSVSLGPISLPPMIQDRIDKIKDTRLKELQKAEDQKIAMLNKQNEKALARENAEIQRIDAESLAAQNLILNKSITSEVLRLRELQIREKEIHMMGEALTNGKASTVFIPYGAVDSAGAQMRMFQK